MTRFDHGHPVDEGRRCEGTTKGGRQCKNDALVGKPHCALHGGEAAAQNKRGLAVLSSLLESSEDKRRERYARQRSAIPQQRSRSRPA